MAAKVAGEAVKVVLTREQTFTLLSYRGEVRQRLRIGAEADGRLRAIVQEPDVAKGAKGRYVEPVGEVPLQIYAHRSHLLRHRVAALDLNGTGWMRAPGMSSAIFALETAMDELAREQALDPIELKRRNHAETNPQTGKPWGSKSLLACYEEGARAIGWAGRAPGRSAAPRWTGDGLRHATSFDLGRQFRPLPRSSCGPTARRPCQWPWPRWGQGTLTALATLSAEALGLSRDRVRLRTQEAYLPYGAGSIGSTGLFSNAGRRAGGRRGAARSARPQGQPRPGLGAPWARPEPSALHDGRLVAPDGWARSWARSWPGTAARSAARRGRAATFGAGKLAKASFGAVFTEVAVDPVTLEVSVERLVGAFACGRIVEPVIARNQVAGGMIWGLGRRSSRKAGSTAARGAGPTPTLPRH
jgi:xanthine dehydrogenase YagR molybdenum-binding subunit